MGGGRYPLARLRLHPARLEDVLVVCEHMFVSFVTCQHCLGRIDTSGGGTDTIAYCSLVLSLAVTPAAVSTKV